MRIFVTGATGFIGRNLCRHLKSVGHYVIASGRTSAAHNDIHCDEFVQFSLENVPDLKPHLTNVDAVIHLAARVHVFNDNPLTAESAHRKTNVEGTIQLLKQSIACHVPKFIFTSSIGVNGTNSKATPYTELDQPQPAGAYGLSKYEAELAIQKLCHGSLTDYVILRPPMVYGPDAGANFLRLVRFTQRGFPFPLAGIHSRRSFIFIDNLVDALRFCLLPKVKNETFLIADKETMPVSQLIRELGQHLAQPARMLWVPLPLLRFFAFLVGRTDDLKKLIESCEINTEKIHMWGWLPPVPMSEALRQTVITYLRTQHEKTRTVTPPSLNWDLSEPLKIEEQHAGK